MEGVKEVVAHVTADGKLFLNRDEAERYAVQLAIRLEEARRFLAVLTESQCRDKQQIIGMKGRAKAKVQSDINWRAGRIGRAVEFINSCGVSVYQEDCK